MASLALSHSLHALSHRWQWTERFLLIFISQNFPSFEWCLFDDGIKKKERVYKVISRRIIKHHEMILECFLWWCLASTSSRFFVSLPPFANGGKVFGILFMESKLKSCPHAASWRLLMMVKDRNSDVDGCAEGVSDVVGEEVVKSCDTPDPTLRTSIIGLCCVDLL